MGSGEATRVSRSGLRTTRSDLQELLKNVPAELREFAQWMCHLDEKKPDGRIARAPRSPHTGIKAAISARAPR